ncbi:MAG: hypothetical protein D6698_00860, partial [Gammaproteobacteria bacterium]
MSHKIKTNLDLSQIFYLGEMTTSQRLGAAAQAGAMVYDSDLDAVFVHTGTQWAKMGSEPPTPNISANMGNAIVAGSDQGPYMFGRANYHAINAPTTLDFSTGVPDNGAIYSVDGAPGGSTITITKNTRLPIIHMEYCFIR